ncbi:MAG: YHYH domain-containing protein [Clostridiales bacterium]|nr:YHYH domain-containing protein [Clostridiales bacterium]
MKRRILTLVLSCSLIFGAVPAYAHSGRTDSAGGHHDYNNVSGLGSYHYHHGYGPHLHPNGVCPYESSQSQPTTVPSKPVAKPSQPVVQPSKPAVAPSKPAAVATPSMPKNTMTVYVNGQRIFADNYIIDDTTYLPIRAVADSLGATISFDAIAKTATITVPQKTNVITETVKEKDVAMSNYLIASIYAANISREMQMIETDIYFLLTNNSMENRQNLYNAIVSLTYYIDDIYNYKLDMLYPLADKAANLAYSAEECLSLATQNNIQSEFTNNAGDVINYLFDGLKEADIIYDNAFDYALSK